jgi:hypothetical protein
VRSLLVPALTLEIGPTIWWPSKLRHVPDPLEPLDAATQLDAHAKAPSA